MTHPLMNQIRRLDTVIDHPITQSVYRYGCEKVNDLYLTLTRATPSSRVANQIASLQTSGVASLRNEIQGYVDQHTKQLASIETAKQEWEMCAKTYGADALNTLEAKSRYETLAASQKKEEECQGYHAWRLSLPATDGSSPESEIAGKIAALQQKLVQMNLNQRTWIPFNVLTVVAVPVIAVAAQHICL